MAGARRKTLGERGDAGICGVAAPLQCHHIDCVPAPGICPPGALARMPTRFGANPEDSCGAWCTAVARAYLQPPGISLLLHPLFDILMIIHAAAKCSRRFAFLPLFAVETRPRGRGPSGTRFGLCTAPCIRLTRTSNHLEGVLARDRPGASCALPGLPHGGATIPVAVEFQSGYHQANKRRRCDHASYPTGFPPGGTRSGSPGAGAIALWQPQRGNPFRQDNGKTGI